MSETEFLTADELVEVTGYKHVASQAERELMQRVQALPIGRELRIHYAELWRAVSDDNAPPSPAQERAFISRISRRTARVDGAVWR